MRTSIVCLILLCALGGASLHAQDVHVDFLKGHRVLQRAVAYHGGPSVIADLPGLSVELEGVIRNPEQGYRAGPLTTEADLPEPEAYALRATLDFRNARAHFVQEQHIRGGLRLRFDSYFEDGVLWSGATYAETYTSGAGTLDAALVPLRRWLPLFALRAALSSLAGVTYLGPSAVDPLAEVVAFSWPDGTRDRLHVRVSDGRVVALDGIVPDRFVGSDRALFRYEAWDASGEWPLPTRVTLSRHWGTIAELNVTRVEPGTDFPAAAFTPPSGFTEVPSRPQTTRVAGRVWEIAGLGGGIYRVQFVDLDDRVVVFEAPLGIAVGRQVLAEIRGAVGDKPITHVVLSHFHSDHSAGLRPLVEAGATVVVAPENLALVRRLARAPLPHMFALEQPAPPSDVATATVEVGSPYVIESAAGRVTVHNLGAFPHAESMVVAHVDPAHVLLNGDLFSRISLFNETFARFADWLGTAGVDVEWVLGTHHEPLTPAVIREAAR